MAACEGFLFWPHSKRNFVRLEGCFKIQDGVNFLILRLLFNGEEKKSALSGINFSLKGQLSVILFGKNT